MKYFLLLFLLINIVNASDGEVAPGSVTPLLFLFVAITISCALMHFMSRLKYFEKIPYAVVIFLEGLVLSSLASVNITGWSKSLNDWLNFDPDLMLYAFLPALVFGESMDLTWHHVKGSIWQSLSLAMPGSIAGSLLVGVILKLTVLTNWSWYLVFTLASALCATDTDAITSLLEKSGASQKMTVLLVVTSIVNDGTTLFLFATFFYQAVSGNPSVEAEEVLLLFLRSYILSPVVGLALGLIAFRWMRKVRRSLQEVDSTIQIIITVNLAYLSFFFAQYSFESSGVLSCFSAGLVYCWVGRPLVLNSVTMHNIWSFITWVANTLIFLVAGLIFGHRTLSNVVFVDWFIVLFIYALLNLVRFIVVLVLYPVVKRVGNRCTAREAMFIGWSGLRGAVSISLALVVELGNSSNISSEQGSKFLFYVGGVVALSILINGGLAPYVLQFLKLVGDDSDESEMVKNAIRKRLRYKIERFIMETSDISVEEKEKLKNSCMLLRGNNTTGPAPLAELEIESEENLIISHLFTEKPSPMGSNPLSAAPTGDEPRKSFAAEAEEWKDVQRKSFSNRGKQHILPEVLRYTRTVFLELCRVRYWHMISVNKIPRDCFSARFLLYTVDYAIDTVKYRLGDWQLIEDYFENIEWSIRILSWIVLHLPRCLGPEIMLRIGGFTLAYFMCRRERRAVYVIRSFIEAHEHAQSRIHAFLGDGDHCSADETPEEKFVKMESLLLVERAKEILRLFPAAVVNAVEAQQRAAMILSKEVEYIKSMVEEGLLTTKHAEEFIEDITKGYHDAEKEREQFYIERIAHKNISVGMKARESLVGRDSITNRDSLLENLDRTKSVDRDVAVIRPSMVEYTYKKSTRNIELPLTI